MSGREEEAAIDSSENAAEENGGSERVSLIVDKEVSSIISFNRADRAPNARSP